MSKIHLSVNANEQLKKYLSSLHHEIRYVSAMAKVDEPISTHPDIYMCHLGKEVYHGNPKALSYDYPRHAIFNGCSTGKYFIHNLKYTDSELLKKVRSLGQIEVNTAQGYAKCSCVVVDENSIITADGGIKKASEKAGIDVLYIEPKQVILHGYPYGFIGGASGKVGNTIIFNGDISKHSNFSEIKNFIESRSLEMIYFNTYPLTDIGSIIEEI
jgi:hypothetical protein